MKKDHSFSIAAVIILAGVILSCFGPSPAAAGADASSVASQCQINVAPATPAVIHHHVKV